MKLLTSAVGFAGLLAFNNTTTADVLLLEDFVDATINYTTSVAELTDNDRDFFNRTDGSDHSGGVVYSGIAGSSYFASVGDLNATAISSHCDLPVRLLDHSGGAIRHCYRLDSESALCF